MHPPHNEKARAGVPGLSVWFRSAVKVEQNLSSQSPDSKQVCPLHVDAPARRVKTLDELRDGLEFVGLRARRTR
jgi:hypothetical protein